MGTDKHTPTLEIQSPSQVIFLSGHNLIEFYGEAVTMRKLGRGVSSETLERA